MGPTNILGKFTLKSCLCTFFISSHQYHYDDNHVNFWGGSDTIEVLFSFQAICSLCYSTSFAFCSVEFYMWNFIFKSVLKTYKFCKIFFRLLFFSILMLSSCLCLCECVFLFLCVSAITTRQRGLFFDEGRNWPFSVGTLIDQRSRPPPPLCRRLNIFCVKCLHNISDQTEERMPSVTLQQIFVLS